MDDLSGKINELFSNPESMEQIRSLMNMLGVGGSNSAGGNPNTGSERNESVRPPESSRSEESGLPMDAETLSKIGRALSLMNRDDPRVSLLIALKPNLSENRRKKVDDAIHLLRLLNLLPLLKEELL